MKLKYMMLPLMLGAIAPTLRAQSQDLAVGAPYKTAFKKDACANWFVTVQGGASAMFLRGNNAPSLSDRLTITPSIAVGKWYNPNFATRLKLEGGQVKTFGKGVSDKHTNKFVGAHYDFLFDLVNYFSDYREDRLFHLIPFTGLGYEYKFDSSLGQTNVHALTANAGLQLAFHLGKRVDFVVEGQATFNNINLSKPYSGYSNELRLTTSAGLNFHLGRTGFAPVRPADQQLIAGLQSQINALRAENAELSKRPESCPEVVITPLTEATSADRFLAAKSVLFKHGKSQVSNDQLITLFDAAQFVEKQGGEIVVTGYAQKAESRFSKLAEDRAKAVAQILTNKYNVPAEKITIEWKNAQDASAYEAAAWNRVVVIRSK